GRIPEERAGVDPQVVDEGLPGLGLLPEPAEEREVVQLAVALHPLVHPPPELGSLVGGQVEADLLVEPAQESSPREIDPRLVLPARTQLPPATGHRRHPHPPVPGFTLRYRPPRPIRAAPRARLTPPASPPRPPR